MKANMNIFDYIAVVLVVIGAVNWGLIGILNLDLVATLFGDMSVISRIVYTLVGVAGIWVIFMCTKCCKSS